MSRLSTHMNALLKAEIIVRLNARKIFTALDFIQEDPEKLVPITSLSYKDILCIRNSLIENYSAFPCHGADHYNDSASNSAIVPTGITRLDEILDGGFYTGHLYEVCGLPGSGKTQLCLTIAANVAQHLRQPVHYVDTKSKFSGKRIQDILDHRQCSEAEVGCVMERISVTACEDVGKLLAYLHHLKNTFHQDHDSKSGVRLVIVDSLPPLFFNFLGGESKDSLGLLSQMANVMKYLTLEYHIVFFLVNLLTRWHEKDTKLEDIPYDGLDCTVKINSEVTKPALGKFWLHIPSVRLVIEPSDIECKQQVKVLKTMNVPSLTCDLTLEACGFVSV